MLEDVNDAFDPNSSELESGHALETDPQDSMNHEYGVYQDITFYEFDLNGDGEIDTIAVTDLEEPDAVDINQGQSEMSLMEDACPVVGDPSDTENWRQQGYSNTCAIVSQEFILDELTGHDFTEEELMQIAYSNGWYDPNPNGGGTPPAHVGNLLEAFGIPVERYFQGATFETLAEKLAQGEKVIVALDADEIWTSGQDSLQDDLLQDQPGMPGQDANHAVQVVGIDYSDPDDPKVILNDPGTSNGQGVMISQDEFMSAWADSGNFMVSTAIHSTPETTIAFASAASQTHFLGGYYNADGTYHYTSDNTDRDPETGAIVRRW